MLLEITVIWEIVEDGLQEGHTINHALCFGSDLKAVDTIGNYSK